MTTAEKVQAFEAEVRAVIPTGLPAVIRYLPDDPSVVSGLYSKVENGIGFVEGAASYTVTRWIALHEFGHLYDMNNRTRRDAYWSWRFGACPSAPASWAEAQADANGQWHVLPIESYAEAFAAAVAGVREQERTLDYGCPVDALAARVFFGGASPVTGSDTIDVRTLIPFEDNIFGLFTPKDSLTFHWNGPPIPPGADPMMVLRGDANHHIGQGWGGISYHAAIWTDGTLYITRDPNAVVAACGNSVGNARSRHVQVMLGVGQSPTDAQWRRMTELAQSETNVHPHGPFWSATACPGAEIRAWINTKGWEDMTPEQDTMLRRVLAILEAREALVWEARSQRFLDVERGTPYNPNLPPVDPRIKVT